MMTTPIDLPTGQRQATSSPRDSVVNVSQIVTLYKGAPAERVSSLATETMTEVATGLRLVLYL